MQWINAEVKLGVFGPQLGYPHSSAVRGVNGLRELPRGGRSPWRALVVGAACPEAQVDQRRFRSACERTLARLAEVEED